MVARLKLKGIDGRAPPGVELAAQFDSTRENLPGPDTVRIDRLKIFLDSVGGGAWPFLVGGVICLVNSVNERDLDLLNSSTKDSFFGRDFLEGLFAPASEWKFEAITGL